MILRHFHFWCQKVLPLVYDDSLSYYEVLCKITWYINQLIEQDKIFAEEIEELKKEIDFLKEIDIDELKRIIEDAKAMMASVTYTSSIPDGEDAAQAINTAMSNGVRTIYVDSTVDLQEQLDIPSGTSIIGAGGEIHTTDDGVYTIHGAGSERLLTTVIGYFANNAPVTGQPVPEAARVIKVADGSGFTVGNRYKIVGVQDLFNLTVVGPAGFLGNGTSEGTDLVYGAMEFVCKNVDDDVITMDRDAPYYLGSGCLIYAADDVEDITIRDLTVIGPRFMIGFDYCNNIRILNCNINCTGGQHPIGLVHAYDCVVEGNTISSNGLAGGNAYTHNTIVLATAGDCRINNNNFMGGSQAVDITYNRRYSYRNQVNGNIISGCTDDAITTHPAALKTMITGNLCSGNIAVRSKFNSVLNNLVSGFVSVGSKCCDGTVLARNTILASSPVRVSYASADDVIDSIFILDNVCPHADELIRGTVYSIRFSRDPVDTRHICLKMFVSGNIVNRGTEVSAYCFYITGYDSLRDETVFDDQTNVVIPPPFDTLIFTRNSFSGYTSVRIFRNAPKTDNLVIQDNIFNSANLYFRFAAGDVGGTPIIQGNSLHFRDALPEGATNSHFGQGYPPGAAKGDVYTKENGDVGVYLGNDEWITLAHAE